MRPRHWLTSLLFCLGWLALPVYAEELPALGGTLTPVEAVAAPDFSLKDMDGNTHTLSGLRGNYVLLNFWATWCPPCRKEMPSLEYLHQKYGKRPFRVIAVNQWESPDHVFSYMGELEVFPTFPILFDPESSVSEQYGVRGLPTSFLLDPEGRIIYRAIGGRAFDHPDVSALIESLLGSK